MKKLILLTSILLTSNLLAAQFTCGSTKAQHKRTYPINAAAVKAVASLGLKTCTGTSSKRFSELVKQGKHTVKFVVVSAADLRKAKKAVAALGGATGPSL